MQRVVLDQTSRVLDVERLTPDQWRMWRTVRLRALEESPEAFGSTLVDWSGDRDVEQRWRERLEKVPANFIAYWGGAPVGQASGVATDRSGQVELISVWVAPEARGVGVGRGLLDAVREWARDQQAHSLVLSVKVGNAPAIALYEREGFELTTSPVVDGECEMLQRLER